jgi:hypothetical protein
MMYALYERITRAYADGKVERECSGMTSADERASDRIPTDTDRTGSPVGTQNDQRARQSGCINRLPGASLL